MNVLVPIDRSDPARDAIEYAVRHYPDASITALHVVDPTAIVYGAEGGTYAYDNFVESRRENAEELFEDVQAIASEYDVSLDTEIVEGGPSREIVSFAEESGTDHVVIGSHGRTGASRVLLGSVAEDVVRRAPVPVTVVR